jgi:hypothetical protein
MPRPESGSGMSSLGVHATVIARTVVTWIQSSAGAARGGVDRDQPRAVALAG